MQLFPKLIYGKTEMILICWLAAAKYGKKVAVLDYVSPSPQGREIINYIINDHFVNLKVVQVHVQI